MIVVFSGLISAVLASVLTIITMNVNKMNELDSKSGWRKSLFKLASKDMMTLCDVYLLRATLRFNKHGAPYELYSFKYFSNEITFFCDSLVIKYSDKRNDEKTVYISDDVDREIIRVYARYLLKNHWEVFSSSFFLHNKEFKIKQEYEIGKETAILIDNIRKSSVGGY